MAFVVILPSARADENEIFTRIAAEAGFGAAQKYQKRFDALYDLIADFPAMYAACRPLGRGIRVGCVKPYLVVYHYAKSRNTVTVLRILHAKRLITRSML